MKTILRGTIHSVEAFAMPSVVGVRGRALIEAEQPADLSGSLVLGGTALPRDSFGRRVRVTIEVLDEIDPDYVK